MCDHPWTMAWRSRPALVLALVTGVAGAQPLAPVTYSPPATGWAGPRVPLGTTNCCGCRGSGVSTEWQVRQEADGFSGAPSAVTGRYTQTWLPGGVHGERYCLRVRHVDDAGPGSWGPSTGNCGVAPADRCFQWDTVPPTEPLLLDAGLLAGTARVVIDFTPSSDDGGGVLGYSLRYPGGPLAHEGVVDVAAPPITDVMGEGTWTIAVYAYDRSDNSSGSSASVTFTFPAQPSLTVPPAPTWDATVSDTNEVGLEWPDDGAQSWVITVERPDGGWALASRPRVTTNGTLLSMAGPCRQHRARIARVVGDEVSAWSTPSAVLLIDEVNPAPPTWQPASVSGADVTLRWNAAGDACPSGMTYTLQRISGGAWMTVTQTSALQFTEAAVALPAEYRLVARDGAGNAATSMVLVVTPGGDAGVVDAGVEDAGVVEPDAGLEVDAGVDDAGLPVDGGDVDAPRELRVGCGCGGGGGAVWLGVLLVPGLRRRARR